MTQDPVFNEALDQRAYTLIFFCLVRQHCGLLKPGRTGVALTSMGGLAQLLQYCLL